ncbi:MAG TPA: iron uptake transporter permease EfeU [Dehalococcoidia bacterium]
MWAALLITLREGLEAALVVAIVLAYLRQIGRRDRFRSVWLGVGGALGLSTLAGVVAYFALDGLEGDARRITFGLVSLAAVAVLTWMIFWMRKQAVNIRKELQAQVDRALESGSTLALASVAFFAILREGLETVLFMMAVLTGSSGLEVGLGGLLGLAGAVLLGYLIYQGGRRINLRRFFQVTGMLIIVFAAGLFARGVAWLQEAGVLTTYLWPVWNLRDNDIVGRGTFAQFLSGLLGWNPSPSIEELLAWALYLIVAGWFFLSGTAGAPRPAAAAPESRTAGG